MPRLSHRYARLGTSNFKEILRHAPAFRINRPNGLAPYLQQPRDRSHSKKCA
jgi:hypothetical protein